MGPETNAVPYDYTYMYDLFTMCHERDHSDLAVQTISMFISEHPDLMTYSDGDQYREFIGAYYNELTDAYKKMDKDQFDAYVKELSETDTENKIAYEDSKD